MENVSQGTEPGQRVLALQYAFQSSGTSTALTPTFIPPAAIDMPGYGLFAAPTLYTGQTLRARLLADAKNPGSVAVRFHLQIYGQDDRVFDVRGPRQNLVPGEGIDLEWQVPDPGGAPIAQVGISISADEATRGVVYLDRLSWDGSPDLAFRRPNESGKMWKRQWVNAAD